MFLFPILLAAGLGLAFRNRPAEVLKVGGGGAAGCGGAASRRSCSTCQNWTIALREASLRAGKIVLIAEPGNGGVVYQYDDTNPEGRTARMLADRAVQEGCGARWIP